MRRPAARGSAARCSASSTERADGGVEGEGGRRGLFLGAPSLPRPPNRHRRPPPLLPPNTKQQKTKSSSCRVSFRAPPTKNSFRFRNTPPCKHKARTTSGRFRLKRVAASPRELFALKTPRPHAAGNPQRAESTHTHTQHAEHLQTTNRVARARDSQKLSLFVFTRTQEKASSFETTPRRARHSLSSRRARAPANNGGGGGGRARGRGQAADRRARAARALEGARAGVRGGPRQLLARLQRGRPMLRRVR